MTAHGGRAVGAAVDKHDQAGRALIDDRPSLQLEHVDKGRDGRRRLVEWEGEGEVDQLRWRGGQLRR
jgi:hypothetical protein